MHPNDAAILNRMLARETASAIHYISGAWPWAEVADQPTLERLKQLVAAEQDLCKGIAELLIRRRQAPQIGTFPEWHTELNYLSLDHLVPRLAEAEQKLIAAMERDLAGLEDAEARDLIQHVLETKRHHLSELEQMAAARKLAGTKV